MSDKIWSFWEPKSGIHGYLELCMETWKKLGRRVIILDNDNIRQYLPSKDVRMLEENRHFYSLAAYSDAVRKMVLYRHGGIWMDVDTVVVDAQKMDAIEKLKSETELLMVGKHNGWMWASKGSKVIENSYKQTIKKLNFNKYKLNRDGNLRKYWRAIKFIIYTIKNEPQKIAELSEYINSSTISWDYLANSIMDPLVNKANRSEYIDLTEMLPYKTFIPESATWKDKYRDDPEKPKKYADFYFGKKDNSAKIKDSVFLCLHNSWTPEKYKNMNRHDFLKSDTTLAHVMKKVLRQVN